MFFRMLDFDHFYFNELRVNTKMHFCICLKYYFLDIQKYIFVSGLMELFDFISIVFHMGLIFSTM